MGPCFYVLQHMHHLVQEDRGFCSYLHFHPLLDKRSQQLGSPEDYEHALWSLLSMFNESFYINRLQHSLWYPAPYPQTDILLKKHWAETPKHVTKLHFQLLTLQPKDQTSSLPGT